VIQGLVPHFGHTGVPFLHSYLLEIGRTWYCRTRIPRDLKSPFPRSEIKKSLRSIEEEQIIGAVRFC